MWDSVRKWCTKVVPPADRAAYENGTLTLSFEDATAIEAGKPYLVRWTGDGSEDISSPVFREVTITTGNTYQNEVYTPYVSFVGGVWDPVTFTAADNSILYMGLGSKLYYPNGAMSIGAFRTYFKLAEGYTAGTLPVEEMNFDGDMTTALGLTPALSSIGEGSDCFYTLDGRKIVNSHSVGSLLPKGDVYKRQVYIYKSKKIIK